MQTTLQTRLIILMVISSIFLISAFTFIQLNNQLQQAHEFNIYRAKQEAFVAKDELQDLFMKAGKDTPSSSIHSRVKEIFASLLQSGTIETAVLLDRNGSPVILEGNLKLFFEDKKELLDEIIESEGLSRWLIPYVDKEHQIINLFVVVNNPYDYLVKLTLSVGNLQSALNAVYRPVLFTVVIVIIGNIILAILLSRLMISPITLLNKATKDVASGNLDLKVSITTKDELQELANTFNYMTAELKKMKAIAENVNPLTKLPGNIVIQEEVEKRIRENKKFVLIYGDLDNFKAFNDKYGVHAGDKAIMLTADVFKEAVEKEGQGDDFIGHEGGDDFLLLTVPARAEKIATYVSDKFNERIRNLYSKEDLKHGYIIAKSRDTSETKKFPIMRISLAGVSNVDREITSYAQATNIAADVKKLAKKDPGRRFFIDRRSVDLGMKFREK